MGKVAGFMSKQLKQDLEEYERKINDSFETWFKGIKLEEGREANYYKPLFHMAYYAGYHNGFKQAVDKWLEEHSI